MNVTNNLSLTLICSGQEFD